MAALTTFSKQPVEVLDYDVSFASWLTKIADSISTVSGTATPGITLISVTHASGVVKTWLSGGKENNTYTITLLVTTTGGRVKQFEFQVRVKDT